MTAMLPWFSGDMDPLSNRGSERVNELVLAHELAPQEPDGDGEHHHHDQGRRSQSDHRLFHKSRIHR